MYLVLQTFSFFLFLQSQSTILRYKWYKKAIFTQIKVEKGVFMKKKSRLIASICALVVSLSLLMFGVYASASPKISISGYVTFNISSSQVSVVGTIVDGYDLDGNPIAFLQGRNCHYFDYTDREKTTLADWNINNGQSIWFKEDTTGVTDIKLKFDFANNSPFYTVAKFENVSGSENVSVAYDDQVVMNITGNQDDTVSTTIVYSVIDDSKSATANINFSITFDRYLADTQNFESFKQNISQQKPLTLEQVSTLQQQYNQQRQMQKTTKNQSEDTKIDQTNNLSLQNVQIQQTNTQNDIKEDLLQNLNQTKTGTNDLNIISNKPDSQQTDEQTKINTQQSDKQTKNNIQQSDKQTTTDITQLNNPSEKNIDIQQNAKKLMPQRQENPEIINSPTPQKHIPQSWQRPIIKKPKEKNFNEEQPISNTKPQI